MPFVAHWAARVTLKDSGDNVSTLSYRLRATDYATATAALTAIMAALAAVTAATVSRYSLSQVYEEDAFAYPTGVEVENQALLNIQLDGGLKTARLYIPAAADGIFLAATGEARNIVDVADTDLLTYVECFESGQDAYISDGEDADYLISGKRIHKASRKG